MTSTFVALSSPPILPDRESLEDEDEELSACSPRCWWNWTSVEPGMDNSTSFVVASFAGDNRFSKPKLRLLRGDFDADFDGEK